MTNRSNVLTGFTLIEMLVVIAVIGIIAAILLPGAGTIGRGQILEKETANLASLLTQARANTLASRNSYEYGVHFAANQATLFRGLTYDAATTTNQVLTLNPAVFISGHNLVGGGSDLVFDRLTGATGQSGTITVALAASTTITKIITVSATGVVEMN